MTETRDQSFLGLKNKVAIVTGSATGLGAATAKMLSEAGAKVVINHLSGQESDAHATANACPNEHLCVAADITQNDDCLALAKAAVERWGRIDILINNAGINKPVDHDNLDGLNAEDFHAIFNVNVIGAYQMVRAVAPIMKAQHSGVVVNISSAAGECGYGSSIAYSASKGAMNTMTKSLGRALAPEIRVNAVCPGYIDTPLWDKLDFTDEEREEHRQINISQAPLKLDATPELISRSILFLASDLAANSTGQLLTSDGGVQLGSYTRMFEKKRGSEQ